METHDEEADARIAEQEFRISAESKVENAQTRADTPLDTRLTAEARVRELEVEMEHRQQPLNVQVRYDWIASFDPYKDVSGIMRDTRAAKHQAFRTGDGWLPCSLDANLAQMQRSGAGSAVTTGATTHIMRGRGANGHNGPTERRPAKKEKPLPPCHRREP